MTELLHGQEVIFSQVYRRKKIGEKLIKWLCVSCLATLNYSCLFDCCVWRIYWEVEHRGSRSLSASLHGVQLPKAEKYLNVKTQGCIKVTKVVWAACYWHYFYDCCWFSKTCFCVLFLRSFCSFLLLLVIPVWSRCQPLWLNLSASYLWTTSCVS